MTNGLADWHLLHVTAGHAVSREGDFLLQHSLFPIRYSLFAPPNTPTISAPAPGLPQNVGSPGAHGFCNNSQAIAIARLAALSDMCNTIAGTMRWVRQ